MYFIDQVVLHFFINHQSEWLSALMLIVTYSAGYTVVAIVTILTSLSLFIHKHTYKIWGLIVSIVGSSFSVYFLKEFFERTRPLGAFYFESTHSFPSWHSAIAIALYGFLISLIWKPDFAPPSLQATTGKHEKHHLKNKMIIFLTTLIFLIGLSRLYLGVHYLSDVLAGYLVGAIWLWIALGVSKSKI